MSKQEKASPAAAPETTAESPSGVPNSNLRSPLLSIDVRGFTEKKNGLTYLSWAHAWTEALKVDPAASFRVESWTDDEGHTRCWMEVNGTAMVWVSVTLLGQTRTCMLPVMNSRNEPIEILGKELTDRNGRTRVEKLDAFNVNTAIMRCMTKALALHGLGLNVYAGEDLPMVVEEEAKPKAPIKPPELLQPPEKPAEKPSEPSEKHQLLADGMIQATQVCTTLSGLKSLWKSNQSVLDELERDAPDLFAKVKEVFVNIRKDMEKANG